MFIFFSSSVPKALSALAASDTDEEDHESTPVITTTNGNNENKPTAPLEAVDEKGNFTLVNSEPIKNVLALVKRHSPIVLYIAILQDIFEFRARGLKGVVMFQGCSMT